MIYSDNRIDINSINVNRGFQQEVRQITKGTQCTSKGYQLSG